MFDDFQENFQKEVFNADFGWNRKEIEKFWEENLKVIQENEDFLLQKLQEYAPSTTLDYKGFFYRILYFFQFKAKNDFYSQKIIDFLKSELEKQRQSEKPEFYSNILQAIFSIEGNRASVDFYQNEFQEIKLRNFIFSDIYGTFLEIFIELGENKKIILEEFSEVFCQIIIFSADEVISASVKDAWDYLISLKLNDFNREFFKIINYFDCDEKRTKLEHFNRYLSLYTLNKYDKDTEEFSKLSEKIVISFGEEEYENFSAYIIREVSYLLDIDERAIHENIFIAGSIDILQKHNHDFILELLKNIESEKTFWGLEKIIAQYILPDQVEEFISLLRGQENEYVIFDVYLILKESRRDDIFDIFQKSSYYDEIIKIETRRRETQEKYKKEDEERIQERKEEFFMMLTPLNQGGFHPKFFQDYVEYSSRNGEKFQIFSQEEKKTIDESLIKQIENYFLKIPLENIYQNSNIIAGVTFEKTGENSYSSSWNGYFMTWFLQIAQELPEVKNILISHYKAVLLFYPLIYGDQVNDYFFSDILPRNLERDDVEYLLKVYSEDLHENAKNLRFYQVHNFIHIYNKFSDSFAGFEEKVENIAQNMLGETEKIPHYYRESFLDIYAQVLGETRYRNYWNSLAEKYPNFNYFTDILKNAGEKSTEEINEMRFFITAQTILVERYAEKSDIVWRIKQFLGVEIETTSRFDDDEYPRFRGVRTWSGNGPYEEIEWKSYDRENFAYIFALKQVGNIDVSKEMLKILEESLKIKSKEKKELNLYANYLQNVFFKYFEVFDEKLTTKELYFEILGTLEKFDYKYYYTFNFEFFRKKLGITKIEEEARKILESKDLEKIKLLLGARNNESRQKSNIEFEKSKNDKKLKHRIFTEGITEEIYIKVAADLLGENIIENFEFDLVGSNIYGRGSKNCGDNTLKSFGEILFHRPDHYPENIEKIVFLHDPETKAITTKISENRRIYIFQMNFLDGRTRSFGLCRGGIESLLSDNILNKLHKESGLKGFSLNKAGGAGNEHYEIKDNKSEIAKWICKNAKKEDFEGFKHIFDMLREVLGIEKREEI